ncbi:MAG TPA: class II aldolase/adducin family protein [Bacteroidales bacterium]|nr:class II aldolase/adducin family protein [Bacteroidales bacterium]
MKEGVIKFKCNWTKTDPIESPLIDDLIYWRQALHQKGFVGVDSKGIGYGNLSRRTSGNEFLITGSGTGGFAEIGKQHFALVTSFNIHKNTIDSIGPVIASSESLTHAVLYLCDPKIEAVIHVHNLNMWRALLRRVPKTGKQAEYGTPEMAKEVIRLYSQTDLKNKGILVMAGHEEGIVTFGPNIASAAQTLLQWKEKSI